MMHIKVMHHACDICVFKFKFTSKSTCKGIRRWVDLLYRKQNINKVRMGVPINTSTNMLFMHIGFR